MPLAFNGQPLNRLVRYVGRYAFSFHSCRPKPRRQGDAGTTHHGRHRHRLVGFTSSFAVVLAGLKAVGGANQAQASSGLLALTLTFGLGILWLSWRSRMPVTLAWSTPGAALLASAGMVDGGWPAAVGAFLIVGGVLIVLSGLLPVLGRIMAKIPTALAQAMLAGVLLPLCLAPFKSLGSAPPVHRTSGGVLGGPDEIRTTLVGAGIAARRAGGSRRPHRVQRRSDSRRRPPAKAGVDHTGIYRGSCGGFGAASLHRHHGVTEHSRRRGTEVVRLHHPPWRPSMLVTGAGTIAGAPFGGHAINLAA